MASRASVSNAIFFGGTISSPFPLEFHPILRRYLNAENAEHAENCKDRGTANNMLCEPVAEMALPLSLNPPSAASAFSALKNTVTNG
jgi:hypothetical protein